MQATRLSATGRRNRIDRVGPASAAQGTPRRFSVEISRLEALIGRDVCGISRPCLKKPAEASTLYYKLCT